LHFRHNSLGFRHAIHPHLAEAFLLSNGADRESLVERCLQARRPNLDEIESKWNAVESGIDFQTPAHRSDTPGVGSKLRGTTGETRRHPSQIE
jgi:hypothetical protein